MKTFLPNVPDNTHVIRYEQDEYTFFVKDDNVTIMHRKDIYSRYCQIFEIHIESARVFWWYLLDYGFNPSNSKSWKVDCNNGELVVNMLPH